MYKHAETFLLLKYGTIAEAYRAWRQMSVAEQSANFNTADYEILMEYEYMMQQEGPSPLERR